MASNITDEPVGQILPGPAHISGEVNRNDPQFSTIIQEMRQHGDLSTLGGTVQGEVFGAVQTPRANAGHLGETTGQTYTEPPVQAQTYSQPPVQQQTYAPPPVQQTRMMTPPPQARMTPPPQTSTTGSGFGHSDDFKGFQQHAESRPHGNAAQELLAHHGGAEKDMFGRRKSSSTPSYSAPSDGRRVSTSGYEQQYHPSSFTRTDDLGYTTNPLGGPDVQETSTGGARIVAGRGYLVTGDTGAEGLTSGPMGDFTESGPGGGDKTTGAGLKSRIAALVGRADERKTGTAQHSEGL